MRRDTSDPTDIDVRDLADFCVRWPALRTAVSDEALDDASVSPPTRATIVWLVFLADAVCREVEPRNGNDPLADPRDRLIG